MGSVIVIIDGVEKEFKGDELTSPAHDAITYLNEEMVKECDFNVISQITLSKNCTNFDLLITKQKLKINVEVFVLGVRMGMSL